jgi:uncharacterized membrane protein YdjX (TVP38/TMEM64 family)
MKLKKITFCLWLILVAGVITTYLLFPEKLSPSFMEEAVVDHPFETLIIYYLIISFKGLTFIPATPFLLAGILIFNPMDVFIVNMAGIMTSSTIVYYFSKYMEFDIYFETKYSKYINIIRAKLMDKEFPIIVLWSFLPPAPTDLIIYVASTLRINVFKCLLGVFIGEAIINAFYIITVTMLIKGSTS